MIAEHCRIDAARQRADVLERAVDLVAELAQGRRLVRIGALGLIRGELELDAQPHEPLLGTVVQVALDPPALAVGGRRDPCPRCCQLAQDPGCAARQLIDANAIAASDEATSRNARSSRSAASCRIATV